jgi:hypothetical protein
MSFRVKADRETIKLITPLVITKTLASGEGLFGASYTDSEDRYESGVPKVI